MGRHSYAHSDDGRPTGVRSRQSAQVIDALVWQSTGAKKHASLTGRPTSELRVLSTITFSLCGTNYYSMPSWLPHVGSWNDAGMEHGACLEHRHPRHDLSSTLSVDRIRQLFVARVRVILHVNYSLSLSVSLCEHVHCVSLSFTFRQPL